MQLLRLLERICTQPMRLRVSGNLSIGITKAFDFVNHHILIDRWSISSNYIHEKPYIEPRNIRIYILFRYNVFAKVSRQLIFYFKNRDATEFFKGNLSTVFFSYFGASGFLRKLSIKLYIFKLYYCRIYFR